MTTRGQFFWGNRGVDRKHRVCSSFYIKAVAIGLVWVCFTSIGHSKDTASIHVETSTRFTDSTSSLTESQRALLWKLDQEEWREYKHLMQGPRGLWTPNLDPVHVLGLNAKTPAERQKYARKMARMEYDRLAREGAFSKAYDKEIKKLLNGRKLFPVNPHKETRHEKERRSGNSRIQFFVTLPCDQCLAQIQAWLQDSAAFDIHFLNARNADIKHWVIKMGISPLLVSSRQITLNHISNAQAKALGVTSFPSWRKN